MKKYLIAALLVFEVCIAKAQTKPDSSEVFSKEIDVSAEFPGGLNAFGMFLARNIRYPADARFKHIQGKVYLTYVVEKDGRLSDIKVIKGVSKDLDAEAVRVMKLSPKWVPGQKAGVVARQQYTVPISFALADD
ncbi:energy transducer TonB [Mucilaginibacter mali]|uniref:Energy transducer TonB n=1 Tax=Mucilaginibacter mali TaxID=2740462 RepID=A0A7D4QDP2_9SPHI|nr:energy transducer TonB [Mucilaginibacter mali]QKJ29052.1 energy transducer TonB [Mucilaginibacter mali]